jgi:hypothetical protein
MSAAVPPLPNTPSWRGAQLKHRDNFTYNLGYSVPVSCKVALSAVAAAAAAAAAVVVVVVVVVVAVA